MTNTFKDNWLKKDETCPNCGQVTKRVRGITKQNVKRLLTPRFDLNEIVFTGIIILVLFLAFTYKNETQECRDWLMPMYADNGVNCLVECQTRCGLIENKGLLDDLNETEIKELQNTMKGLNLTVEGYEKRV